MPNTREKLIKLLVNSPGLDTLYGKEEEFAENADWLIANGVTIPVRCGECKTFCRNYAHMRKHCGLTGAIVDDDDFCSYGERRNDVLSDAQLPDGGEL